MSATYNGGPAFPVSTGCNDGQLGHQDGQFTWQFPGMTLRDYFAAKALVGLMSDPTFAKELQRMGKPIGDSMAAAAYGMADSMLKARGA